MNQELKKIIYSARTSKEMHELIALNGIYWSTNDELKMMKQKIVELIKNHKHRELSVFMLDNYNPEKPWLSIFDEETEEAISEPQFYRLYSLA
jgi:hypothetical protein